MPRSGRRCQLLTVQDLEVGRVLKGEIVAVVETGVMVRLSEFVVGKVPRGGLQQGCGGV